MLGPRGPAGRTALLAAALVAGVAAAPVLRAETPPAEAVQGADVQAEAKLAVDAWLAALAGGDPARVAQVLAPEFQIQREDGSGYDREGYLTQGLPNYAEAPVASDLVATGHGDILVVRYTMTVPADATIAGRGVERAAKRLTVFRREGGTWLVSAHANFANPEG